MGKSKKPKQEVNEYYLSIHAGVALQVDAITHLNYGDKRMWEGEVSENTVATINLPDLHGGPKKEGGVRGLVYMMLGGNDQLVPDDLAVSLGRTAQTCPGFRGVTSLYFTGRQTLLQKLVDGAEEPTSPGAFLLYAGAAVFLSLFSKIGNHRGFYWTANSPYLKNIEVGVRRAPVAPALNPANAMILDGSRTPRAICFAIDLSTSMNDNGRLATLKSALTSVLNLIKASVDSGVQVDLSVVTFGSPSQTITRRSATGADVDVVASWVQSRIANATDTDFRAGINSAKTFFDATSGTIEDRFLFFITDGGPSVVSGATPQEIAEQAGAILDTMGDVQSFGINIDLTNTSYTEQVDNTPADGVPVVDDGDETGLRNAVLNALFADDVNGNANPAHMIYEILTDTEAGMGAPDALVDADSFILAAATLYAEGLGLSMRWTQQDTIENFVTEIIDHIQGTLFVNPRTGLLTLKLIRDDYDAENLRDINPDNADMTDFQRKTWGEITNEIVVTWTNPENEQEETIARQDAGAIAAQNGRIISSSRNYYGVRNASVATMLAERDLRAACVPLASAEVELDRTAWDLLPGDVVTLTWPEHGFDGVVMRVGPIDYGTIADPTIKVSLVEDVFSFATAEYEEPPGSQWESDNEDPEAAEFSRIITVPAFLAANYLIDAGVEADLQYPEVISGMLVSSSVGYNFDIWGPTIQADGSTVQEVQATCTLSGHVTLAAALSAEATSTGVTLSDLVGNIAPGVGAIMMIGNPEHGEDEMEIAVIAAADSGQYTLARGLLDTVPRAWDAGTEAWLLGIDSDISDLDMRSDGEDVSLKALIRTFTGVLDPSAAPAVTATLTGRPHYPTRPANVQVNGVAFSSEADVINAIGTPVTVTWSNRNRLTENSQYLLWTDASITPETGQTTLIEVLDPDENLLTTHSGLSGTSFVVPAPDYDGTVRLRVWSERSDDDGDFQSLQYFEHWVLVATSTLLSTPDDELDEPQFILLSGDATDGDDKIELSGDAA